MRLTGAVDLFKGVVVIIIGFGFGLLSATVAVYGVDAMVGRMWLPFMVAMGKKEISLIT